MRAFGRGAVAVLVLGMLWVGTLEPASVTPGWKIGRAVIETWVIPSPGQPPVPGQPAGQPPTPGQPSGPGQKILVLKLSLRNEGAPANVPVRILGRWVVQPPQPFSPLGTFAKEVALKQTAILEIPLFFLNPPSKVPLEVSVMTGHQETDRQRVRVPD